MGGFTGNNKEEETKMEDRPVYAYIPPNLSSTGGLLGGMFNTRQLFEGIIGAGLAAILYLMLKAIIPSIIFLYICLGIGILLFIVGLFGVNGEPFSIFLFNIANYEQRRIFVTLRPPMPDVTKKKHDAADVEDNKIFMLLRGQFRKEEGE